MKQLGLITILAISAAHMTGCSEKPQPPAQHPRSAKKVERISPPGIEKILSSGGGFADDSHTFWRCNRTGALIDAIPMKKSWWYIVEPSNPAECSFVQISRAEFEKIEKESKNQTNNTSKNNQQPTDRLYEPSK